MDTLEYRYKPKPWVMLATMLFFAAAGAFLAMEAFTNERGLVIQRIIHLSPQGATITYWCLAGICALFAIVGLAGFIAGLVSRQYLRLTMTEISAPKFAWSRTHTIVRLKEITDISVQSVQNQRFLNLRYPGGKLSITQSFLPTPAAFEEIHRTIVSRVRIAAA
jgi:hypothetical protein